MLMDKTNPKVSVIVPVYKVEKYLHECINSILAQTFKDFELILVDDGSPDRSGEICDEYARRDDRVRVIHKPNGGVSSARQCGIDHARSEYTIHADPDDWVEPTMLAELYAKAQEENADVVICDFLVNDTRGQQYISQRPSELKPSTVLRELFQQLHGSCCNKLIKRACYSKYGVSFPTMLSYCEDLYVCSSIMRHDDVRVAYVPRAFYHYVRGDNAGSLVRTRPVEQDLLMIDLFQDILPVDLFVQVARPRMCYGAAMIAFLNPNVSSAEFVRKIGPLRRYFVQSRQSSRLWRAIFVLCTLGMKGPLYCLFKLKCKLLNQTL